MARCKAAPFPVCPLALFVAYYSPAELGCFRALGWPIPENVLDLYVEFRCQTNGRELVSGRGLLGALVYHGLDALASQEKQELRELILGRGPWSEKERIAILNYCESDVLALAKLLPEMAGNIKLDYALLRGSYAGAASAMEFLGVPIDTQTFGVLKNDWSNIQQKLVNDVDADYGVYEGSAFKSAKFQNYLSSQGIPWPRIESGRLDFRDETFKSMAQAYPQLEPLRQLRSTLSKFRPSELQVGDDGRNRCMLSIFSSKTGRNQPSTNRFIFGLAAWQRGLIKPAKGFAIAYIDWGQQEFGIAAALSGDPQMMEAYRSGDPYLAFAIQAGAAPPEATKQSHKLVREQFKACVLAVQYGMGPESLAQRIKQPIARAHQLLDLHRRTYKRFWIWLDGVLNQALLKGNLWTTYGWHIQVGPGANGRSLCNFPMQANGAEMLRIACIQMVAEGIRVCAPVHDAVLIEAPINDIDQQVQKSQVIMKNVSGILLNGFHLETDVKIVRYPDRYMDERGAAMWNRVMRLANLPDRLVEEE